MQISINKNLYTAFYSNLSFSYHNNITAIYMHQYFLEVKMSKRIIPKLPVPADTVKPIEITNEIQDISLSKNIPIVDSTEVTPPTQTSDLSISSTISKSADTLKNINIIKDEICKLPLDPCESEFITINVTPLLTVLTQLSAISVNLATSAYYLTLSTVLQPKHSKIKDTTHLVYNINDECEDVYHVVKKRINDVLNKKC